MTQESARANRIAGQRRQKADPRRARPVSINVIIAAWRRGWHLGQIAFASGVSYQRINQRIKAYEKCHGSVARIERPSAPRTTTFPWRCAYCDALTWSPRMRIKSGEQHFCSTRCYSMHKRVLSDDDVESAIYLRWEGNTWTHIAKLMGYPQQTIQSRIWKYLYLTGQLNRGVVESIWVKNHLEQRITPAWNWLELNTGIYCTEHGAEQGHRRGGQSAWGSKLASSGTPTS
jgi:hypothetical protein